jgi:hypothetical protein
MRAYRLTSRALAAACDAARAGVSVVLRLKQLPPFTAASLDPAAAALLPPVFDFTADALCSCGLPHPCISMLLL